MKGNLKKYLASFFIPVIIFLIAEALKGFNLNGSDLIVDDLREQYTYFLLFLKKVIMGEESIIYSFQVGLGTNMFPNFAYYIACPFNILIILSLTISPSIFYYTLF